MYLVRLPLHIDLPKKKSKDERFLLNLNVYRNAHFYKLNQAKELYENQVEELIKHLPEMEKINLTYVLYLGSNRSADVSNICSIVDKFFCDALVAAKKIEDDNYKVISSVSYQFGDIDKNDPRVEVWVQPQ